MSWVITGLKHLQHEWIVEVKNMIRTCTMCFIIGVYKGNCSLHTTFFQVHRKIFPNIQLEGCFFFWFLSFKIPCHLNEILYNPVSCLCFIVLSFFLNISVVPKWILSQKNTRGKIRNIMDQNLKWGNLILTE